MKYRPTRKILTHEQANDIFQNCQQGINNEVENIYYWKSKIGKKLEPLDSFILMTDKFTIEQAIESSEKRIEYLSDKLNDMRRFFDKDKKVRKIF